MPIEGFDFKAFAIDLANQAGAILNTEGGSNAAPSSLTDVEKKAIVDIVRKFCLMAGDALNKEDKLNLNAQQASIITQFIGEWTFHKSIDLSNGKIPQEMREPILQVIAANIYNTAKLAMIKKMPEDSLIGLIEEKVNHVYKDELAKLVKKGTLTEKQFNLAVNSSNLDEMVQKVEEEKTISNISDNAGPQNDNEKKVIKLAALAIVLKRLPSKYVDLILGSLSKQDVTHVLNYIKMPNIEEKIDPDLIIKVLNEIKQIIPLSDSMNISKILKKYRELTKSVNRNFLEKIAVAERQGVRSFILDEKFAAQEMFSSQVIKSLVGSVEEKINDYQKKVCKR